VPISLIEYSPSGGAMSEDWRFPVVLEKLLVTGIGALVASSLYLVIALQDREIFSLHVLGYAHLIAVLSIAASAVALNLGRLRVASVLITVLLVPVLLWLQFLLAFAHAFVDWARLRDMSVLLAAPLLPVAALVVRRWHHMGLLLSSAVACLALLVVGLQVAAHVALERQFSRTFAKGGCVVAGDDVPRQDAKRQITNPGEVRHGWLIGSETERVYFVFEDHYQRWSVSRFGVETRNGQPVAFPLDSVIKC